MPVLATLHPVLTLTHLSPWGKYPLLSAGEDMGEIKILLGFEVGTGKEVNMGLHHTIITGMTQLSGKTTTMEAIISRANRRAIAFKTKRGESGFNNYREIPPFFEERADWQYVSTLLEAVMREKMKFERPWIMKATQGTNSLREVLENVQMLRAETTTVTTRECLHRPRGVP